MPPFFSTCARIRLRRPTIQAYPERANAHHLDFSSQPSPRPPSPHHLDRPSLPGPSLARPLHTDWSARPCTAHPSPSRLASAPQYTSAPASPYHLDQPTLPHSRPPHSDIPGHPAPLRTSPPRLAWPALPRPLQPDYSRQAPPWRYAPPQTDNVANFGETMTKVQASVYPLREAEVRTEQV